VRRTGDARPAWATEVDERVAVLEAATRLCCAGCTERAWTDEDARTAAVDLRVEYAVALGSAGA
jgi:hypothetical protein